MVLMAVRIQLGAAKAEKEKIGKDWRTDLRRMRQLGRLRTRKVQEDSPFPMEERIPSHEELRRALVISGMPRYLDGRELCVKPRILVMCS
jgi:hypothetical protein